MENFTIFIVAVICMLAAALLVSGSRNRQLQDQLAREAEERRRMEEEFRRREEERQREIEDLQRLNRKIEREKNREKYFNRFLKIILPAIVTVAWSIYTGDLKEGGIAGFLTHFFSKLLTGGR